MAPALANALQDATGVRYRELPLTPERIYGRLDSTKLIAGNVSMDTEKPTDTAATVIIGQKVRPGSEQEFMAWQHELNEAASHYPGFIGAEITPPTAVQPDWVVVYRFDSIANLPGLDQQRHSAGAARRRASSLVDGPATQQVVGGDREAGRPAGDSRRDPPRQA